MAVNSNDDARFKVVEYSPEKAEMIDIPIILIGNLYSSQFLKEKECSCAFNRVCCTCCIFLRCTCNRKIRLSYSCHR